MKMLNQNQLQSELDSELKQLQSELNSELKQLQSEINSELNQPQSEINTELNQPQSEINSELKLRNRENNMSNNNQENIIQRVIQIEEHTISIGEWILMFIVQCIPIVDIIMLIIWALDTSNRTRANYARAIIILTLIAILLAVVFGGAIIAGIISLVSHANT
jgi:hypothetical protein